MTPFSRRIRILLLALSATIGAALLLWDDSDESDHPRGRNRAGGAPAVTAAATPAASADSHMAPEPISLSDEEFARQNEEFGVVVTRSDQSPSNPGSFYFVDLVDSSRTLRSLGFIRAGTLLDTAATFDGIGDVATSQRLHVASAQFVDSILREREDGCVLQRPIPLRPSTPSPAPWRLALAAGGAEAVPATAWRIVRDTVADHAEALRLMSKLPMHPIHAAFIARQDSARAAEEKANAYQTARYGDARDDAWRDSARRADSTRRAREDSLLARVPWRMSALHRFTLDGTEFMLVSATRFWEPDSTARGAIGGFDMLGEQLAFVAERDPRDPASPFQVVLHHHDVDPELDTMQEPLFLLRLGEERLLTLVAGWSYAEGGGTFYSRVGRGHWKETARWIAGC